MFESKPESTRKTSGPSFGYPPMNCKCGCQASVSLITVMNTNNGKCHTGPASEYCGRDNHNNPNWQLQDWYRFMGWRSYCPACYSGEPPGGQRKYTDKQVTVAWRWLLGEMNDRDGIDMGFTKVKLTDEQKDRAIEIVNHEASRQHKPDAIPDKYKLAEFWA